MGESQSGTEMGMGEKRDNCLFETKGTRETIETKGTIVISAPAKIILFGEHSVVHGKKAIATSLDLRTFGYLNRITNIHLNLQDLDFEYTWESKVEMVDCPRKAFNALRAFVEIFKDLRIGFSLIIKSNVPIGSGLGSSASYSVVIGAAYNYLLSRNLEMANSLAFKSTNLEYGNLSKSDLEIINSLAFKAEQIMHHNPSGLDNTVCCFGGPLVYVKGKAPEKLDKIQHKFLLIGSRIPKDTKAQVEFVAKRNEKYPEIMKSILDAMGALAETATTCLTDKSKLAELIDMNHHLLNACGVGHPELEKIKSICSKHDASCKITGAGGGGYMLALAKNNDTSQLQRELEANGYDTFYTTSGNGVEIHQIE